MCRHLLHIAAALLTCSVGFLTVDKFENLPRALPLALCVFVCTRTILELKFKFPTEVDSHKLKVVALTLLLWIPILVVYLPLFIPPSGLGNCTPDLP